MAALITADADATMAADVITDVDVTVDGDFQAEIIPAAISSGSSSFCACAETITADAAMAAADVATVTTAGLLSCCFCYAETMAVDVAAMAALPTTAAAAIAAVATTTVDAAMEPVFSEIIPAAVFFGSSA